MKEIEKTKIDLCETCVFEIPTCKAWNAIPSEIVFGNGKGNDNIIKCSDYKELTK